MSRAPTPPPLNLSPETLRKLDAIEANMKEATRLLSETADNFRVVGLLAIVALFLATLDLILVVMF